MLSTKNAQETQPKMTTTAQVNAVSEFTTDKSETAGEPEPRDETSAPEPEIANVGPVEDSQLLARWEAAMARNLAALTDDPHAVVACTDTNSETLHNPQYAAGERSNPTPRAATGVLQQLISEPEDTAVGSNNAPTEGSPPHE